MRLYKIILFFVLLIGITSCKKDIEVSPNSTFEGQLFIESILIPGKLPRLFLSNSLPFFDSNVTPQEVFARGASAMISSNSLTDFLAPDSTFDKFRCRWVPFYKGSFLTQSGQTYDLLVTYRGKTYTATTTIDQPQVRIESVEYIEEFFDIYGGHDGVRIKFVDAPGLGNFYRFQMNRMMDKTRLHAHVLDVIKSDCTQDGEKFLTTDLGRIIFSDENIDGQLLDLLLEVSFEYREGDTTYVFMQSLDNNSAEFFQDLDDQLQSILNPFVEPVFLDTKIEGAIGVFGSAVLSDSVLFIYPQNNP